MKPSGWRIENRLSETRPGIGSRVPKGKTRTWVRRWMGFSRVLSRCLVPSSMDLVKFTKMSCGTSRKMWMSLRTMSCLPCSAMVAAGVCRAEGSAAAFAQKTLTKKRPQTDAHVDDAWKPRNRDCQRRLFVNGRFWKPTSTRVVPPAAAVRTARVRTESRAAVGYRGRLRGRAPRSSLPPRPRRGPRTASHIRPSARKASFRVPNLERDAR